MNLFVCGHSVSFIVDSGATHSVITTSALSAPPPLSTRTIVSVGASGSQVTEHFTVPIPVISPFSNEEVLHSFLCSPCCPFNLLGRDLILQFQIKLVPTEDGVKPVKKEDLTYSMVKQILKPTFSPPLYVYQWWICFSLACDLITSAQDKVSPGAEFMQACNLHCTAKVSFDRDLEYEEDFFSDLNDELSTINLYWSATRCALSVCLSPTQSLFYVIPSSDPHVSLAKGPTDQWRELGPRTKKM